MIELTTTVRRRPDLLASDMDDEMVMFDIEQGNYFGLDPIGSAIWEKLENPILVSQLVDHLLDEFEVDRATCEQDTLEFLAELHKNKLLVTE